MTPSTASLSSNDASVSRVTKLAPRVLEDNKKAKKKGYAGAYRMIHGSLVLPLPWADWHTASGKIRRGAPRTVTATVHPSKFAIADDEQEGIRKGDPIEFVGDEVWLSDEDAWRLLGMDHPADKRHMHAMVEKLDSMPSRCGKVWSPPKPNPRA